MPGQATVRATRSSGSAEAQSPSALLQPELQAGPKPHRVVFRVNAAGLGEEKKSCR